MSLEGTEISKPLSQVNGLTEYRIMYKGQNNKGAKVTQERLICLTSGRSTMHGGCTLTVQAEWVLSRLLLSSNALESILNALASPLGCVTETLCSPSDC